MFNFIKQAFTNKDLRKRILFTLAVLLVFRLGASLTIPGVTVGDNTFGDGDFFGMINLLGGGALAQFSLFALGVSPYITASIVVQLLAADVVPSLTRLSKEGQKGRAQMNTITKWVALAFAVVQGWALTQTMAGQGMITLDSDFSEWFIILILVAGTMITMWLGDQITKNGIGNGVSLIIFTGIVSSMPYQFYQTFQILVNTSNTSALFIGLLNFAGFIVMYVSIILLIIAVNSAQRKIPMQRAGQRAKSSDEMGFLPLKLNGAGVIPVIFASSIITAPTIIFSFMEESETSWFIEDFLSMTSLSGYLIFISLITLFTFFYTNYVSINPEEMAKNFNNQGMYIPGVKPGKETHTYIRKSLNRLNLFGSLYLILIVTIPIVVPMLLNFNSNLPIGGTSLIIVIGVAIELHKQISGKLTTTSYDDMVKKVVNTKKQGPVAESDPFNNKKNKDNESGLIW